MSDAVAATHPANEAATRGLVSLSDGTADPGLPEVSKRAVIYLRVSTAEQAETTSDGDGLSIAAQRSAAHRKAEELGAEVVDEYADRGESAKTADRPALQILMHRLESLSDIDYVIVHKVDRLARNRADDANLTLDIYKHGAKLVSCTESIDDTPSGKLVHGIMASINEWYSANLGTEATKGMLQKAKQGGTPGRAPVGYRNTIDQSQGREVRTVVLDDDAADHITWAFQEFAAGQIALADLVEVLEDRGLRTLPTRKRPGGPLSKSQVAAMLKNRYYLGIVTFKGVEYPGNHPALIDQVTFMAVQDILEERAKAREKLRTHRHHLAGSVYCGRCGRRLCFTKSTGKLGVKYDYFFCTGRRDRTCDQGFLPIDHIEEQIEDLYHRTRFPGHLVEAVRARVKDEVDAQQADLDRQARKHRGRRKAAEDSLTRLRDAYLEGLFTMDEFKKEQAKIKRQFTAIEAATGAGRVRWEDLSRTLDHALSIATRCDRIYAEGTPEVRRLLNQGLFTKIIVDATDESRGEFSEAFAALLDPELRAAIEAETKTPAGRKARRGSKEFSLAPPTGFEPVLPP